MNWDQDMSPNQAPPHALATNCYLGDSLCHIISYNSIAPNPANALINSGRIIFNPLRFNPKVTVGYDKGRRIVKSITDEKQKTYSQ